MSESAASQWLLSTATRTRARLEDDEYTEFNRVFLVDLVQWFCNSGFSVESIVPVSSRQFAAELLISDLLEYGDGVNLDNDETISQVLGVLGLHYVFGIYKGKRSRLPRRLFLKFLKKRPTQLYSTIGRGLTGLGVLQLHMPKLQNRRLTETHFIASHIRVAYAIREDPSLHALFGASWYFDPALKNISPRLAYLSQFAESHGSILVRMDSDENIVSDATLTSSTRRTLYEKGEYTPTRYGRLWPRLSLMKWLEANDKVGTSVGQTSFDTRSL